MALFRRGDAGRTRQADRSDAERLREFVETRTGVEAYLEPQTAVTATTVVLVAADGEWTRRRVESPKEAAKFADKHRIPLYEAAVVGYPKRMREWTARRKADGQTTA